MATLESVFRTFGNGPEMEGRAFVKLCKDVKIIDAKFKATDADLIFAKVKSKGARKINFTQFKTALDEIAKRKKVDVTDLTVLVEGSSGPEFHGTQTEAVKFYDDKSLFTGVHQHGGPSTVDKGRTQISDLSQLTDRTSYDIRGVHTAIAERIATEQVLSKQGSGKTPSATSSRKNSVNT